MMTDLTEYAKREAEYWASGDRHELAAEWGILHLAEQLQREDVIAMGAYILRDTLNVCGDDRGCFCEDAVEISTEVAGRVLAAMFAKIAEGAADA